MTARDRSRDRILEAAENCLRRDGIRRTTVQAVADEAELSRVYLYRFFPDKATLVSAALMRRDVEFWDAANSRVSAQATFTEMVAEAVLISSESPLGSLALTLAETEPLEYADVMGTYVHEVVPGLAGFWVDQLAAAQGRGLVRTDLDVVAGAEWVIRVVVSLVGIPGLSVDSGDRDSLVRHLATFLSPAFVPGGVVR